MSSNIMTSGGLVETSGKFSKVVDTTLNKNSNNPIANSSVATKIEQIDNSISTLNSGLEFLLKPRCILVDNKGAVSSSYGFTYDILSDMLQNDTWQGKIKNNDYIRLITLNDEAFNLRFNINTYKNYGDNSVGNHIDLISEHLIPSSGGWQMRLENTNNGTANQASPYLASTNMIEKLQTYFVNNIPNELRSHIVTKRILAPGRYSENGALTDDNIWNWADLGMMWLPYESEIAGRSICGSKEWQGGLRQYPCFQDGSQICKNLGESGGRYDWWTASAYSGNSTRFVHVGSGGNIGDSSASDTWFAVPLCIRFK